MKNKILSLALCFIGLMPGLMQAQSTFCNPLDLSYRFMVDNGPSRREAADPTMVLYKGTYYLFASKTGGYWYSDDMKKWDLLLTNQIPTEEYAPTAIVMRDSLFFMASNKQKNTIYKTDDPKSGKWIVAKKEIETDAWDPCFFKDNDNKLYLYWGCSDREPLHGVEVDDITFDFKGKSKDLIYPNPKQFGWEIRGDYNTKKDELPWVEGAWVNKYGNKYYLQYAAPGTLEKSYCDAVYTSNTPLGPFIPAETNPFAYKPEGFACGAGHGSTFEDKYGNIWHVGTVAIAVKHKFERRLAMYPSFVDNKGNLYAWTRFGDYPIDIPNKKIKSSAEVNPKWMLLSYDKKVDVSSTLEGHSSNNITDENIRTYWSAASGSNKEWAMIDLSEKCTIDAIQIDIAENNANIWGRKPGIKNRFTVDYSNDKEEWKTLWDNSKSENDNTNCYKELDRSVKARYVRVNNVEVVDGDFALSGIRVFGKGDGKAPKAVKNLIAVRNSDDKREVKLTWEKSSDAIGYNIRYGVAKDMLYNNYMVYSDNELTIRSLDARKKYYFAIEAFSENGVSKISNIYKEK